MTDQPEMMTDLSGKQVPIPQGATQEPIAQQSAQPQDDNMMTDLQGNRVPIPNGATQEPVQQQQMAPGSFQTKPGGPILNASKDIPAPETSFYKKHPANVLYRDIRSNTSPEDIAARQQASKEVDDRIQQPVRTDDIMSAEQQRAHPIIAGGADLATGMISPENIGIMVATEGLGTLSSPQLKTVAKILPRLISAGFTYQQVMGAAKDSEQAWDAIKNGDESGALRAVTRAVGNLGFAALGAQHAAGIEATPETAVGQAIQRPVDKMANTVATRVGQAFKSDASAMATANAAHRAATIIHDQRLNETEHMTDQAYRAAQAYNVAKEKFANGEITEKEMDDAATAASAASANSVKAVKALSDAHENLSQTGAEVDRMGRKIDRARYKTTEKQDRAVNGALEDHMRAFPPTTGRQGQYNLKDARITLGYAEEAAKTNPIHTVQDYADTLQDISDNIDNEVGGHIQKYGKDPITTNVKMDVRDALKDSTQVNFVHDALNYLSDNFNLTDPSLEEAQKILTDMNALNRGVLKKNFWDVATALRADPEFAARFHAADSLRKGIDGALVERGVEGVREKRADQASIIRVKTAVEKQVTKGEQRVRGSGASGALRLLGKGATTAGAGIGAAIGGLTQIPGAIEAGAMAGGYAGKKIGERIAPGDSTRNELTSKIHSISGKGFPTTELDVAGNPAGQYGPPSAISPIMQMYTPQREMTPLHGALATHFGEMVGKSSYNDLEQRFFEEMATKQANNLPIEPDEKKILAQMNDANMQDYVAAQKQMQERNGAGGPTPSATLPEKMEPLFHPPVAKFAEGMDTEKGIVHDMAHVIVGEKNGIKFVDGIGTHLHPDAGGGLMVAPIDWTPFIGEDGKIDPNKLRAKMPQIAATYMAGGVANDLYHDIPFTENHHLGADMKALKGMMKDTGFTEAEATKMIAQAADDARQTLQQPGIQDILEQHASVREAGLDSKYHVSPERMEQILEDVRGVDNVKATGKSARPDTGSKGPDTEDGAGTKTPVKEGDTTELRPEGKGLVEGKSGATQADESAAKPTKSKDIIGERPEEFKPIERPAEGWNKNPKLDETQGGHAGGGVASEEELARPGRFVKISKSGMPTDQGKVPDFNTSAGEAGYQVKPDGTIELKSGQETPATKRGVEAYAKEVFPQNPKLSEVQNATRGYINPSGKFESFNPDTEDSHDDFAFNRGFNDSTDLIKKGWVRKAGQGSYEVGDFNPKTKAAVENDIISDIADMRSTKYGRPRDDIDIKTNQGHYTIPTDDFIEKHNGDLGKAMRVRPENPKFDIPKPTERTTGDPELDQRIKDAGGVPGGLQKGFEYNDKATGEPRVWPDTALVHHESGSTLNVLTDAPVEDIRKQLQDKTDQYAAAAERAKAKSDGIEFSDPKLDHIDPKRKEEFEQAVKGTLGAKVNDDGSVTLDLSRRQKPEQAGEKSIRSGVFFSPEENSPFARHYTGKQGYGGSQKIVEKEVTFKNPLIAKGSTGGKVPEKAYDYLKGKNAYQDMRNEVLDAINSSPYQEEKTERIGDVLENHGADRDYAYDIVQHSKTGNQLPYAVQEHIVAQALRDAGYDSVLGFSKHQGQPRLSEAFDASRQEYPSPAEKKSKPENIAGISALGETNGQ